MQLTKSGAADAAIRRTENPTHQCIKHKFKAWPAANFRRRFRSAVSFLRTEGRQKPRRVKAAGENVGNADFRVADAADARRAGLVA